VDALELPAAEKQRTHSDDRERIVVKRLIIF
jgi:hypothetical protein